MLANVNIRKSTPTKITRERDQNLAARRKAFGCVNEDCRRQISLVKTNLGNKKKTNLPERSNPSNVASTEYVRQRVTGSQGATMSAPLRDSAI